VHQHVARFVQNNRRRLFGFPGFVVVWSWIFESRAQAACVGLENTLHQLPGWRGPALTFQLLASRASRQTNIPTATAAIQTADSVLLFVPMLSPLAFGIERRASTRSVDQALSKHSMGWSKDNSLYGIRRREGNRKTLLKSHAMLDI
jgi:hypothetical protein